jgi:signal transduction histidine kinase/ActR/RegA family two-component response regulator/uncharacterized membrane protein
VLIENDTMTRSRRSISAILALACLGLLGNVFHIPLFFGVDFLTGNLFVFVTLALFGAWVGAGVAAVAGAYTYVLWGHPYAWLGMVCQAVLVGMFLHGRRQADEGAQRNLPTGVALCWFLLGPLIALLYHYALGVEWTSALMVAFKQAVNDVLNALIAALLVHYLPLRRWAGLPLDSGGKLLRHLQTNLLAAFAFMPALLVITLISRAEVTRVEDEIKARLDARADSMKGQLDEWINEHLQTSQRLAHQVEQSRNLTSAQLHGDFRFFVAASPDVAAIRVVNEAGKVVLSSDLPLGAGSADLSDREWFARLKAQNKPLVALVPQGRMLKELLLVFVAPVMQTSGQGASFHGGVLLTYRARSFSNMFASEALEDQMRASLLGADGAVIVSSEPGFAAGKSFDAQRAGTIAQRMNGGAYRWHPAGAKSAMQAWSSSYYARHIDLAGGGWSLVVELPLKQHFAALQDKLLNGFVVTFVLALGAFGVGGWLGRRIVRPLNELSQVTTALAGNVSGDQEIVLRRHGLNEIDSLVDNFEGMVRKLRQHYAELMAIRHDLEQRVQERTAALVQQTDELQRARDEAESASRAKSDFLSSMSHELRTPMNAILGFSQLLEMDDLAEPHRQSVHEIHKAGKHLLALINDVLDLSRIESGNIELSIESVEVDPLLDDCYSLVGPLLQKYDVRLSVSGTGRHRHAIRADRVRLKQILLNLLSNAIKYNRPGGKVSVQYQSVADGKLRISVTDTGSGLTAAQTAQLFSAFNRLGAENGSTEGTGIGLVITKRLTEMMGGQIGVHSVPGQGSTFWIEFVRDQARQDAPRASSTQPGALSSAAGKGHEVLYIEDNPANLRLVALALAHRPHINLHTAHEPELGIELAQAKRPDLILLDINLPGINGFEVLRRIRINPRLSRVPVVAVSAKAMPGDVERGRAAGFDEYLSKPIDIEQLLATVDRFLSESKP